MNMHFTYLQQVLPVLLNADSCCPRTIQAAKKMLMDADFLASLRSFDKDHIPPAVIQRVKPYIQNPEFEPNKILTVSATPATVLFTREIKGSLCRYLLQGILTNCCMLEYGIATRVPGLPLPFHLAVGTNKDKISASSC